MKRRLIYFTLLVFLPGTIIAQAAGNVFYNQNRKAKYQSEDAYSGVPASNVQAASQDYAYNQWETQYADSVMAVQADVMINVKPDAYKMVLGLTQVGENLKETHDKINGRISSLKDGLEKVGISQETVYVDFISQAPIFGVEKEKKLFSKNYVEVPAGFEVKKNIHLRFDDIENLQQIITLAAGQEIYDIIAVNPVVYNRKQVYDSLRTKCTGVINTKRDQMEKLGLEITPVFNSLDEKTACYYPIDYYMAYTSYLDHTRQRLREDDKLVSASGNINLFYQGKNDAAFDQVINADYTGPVVQLSMSMRLNYTLKRLGEE
ncbi:MAG: SIMPL domain-containing protein [Bacteroidales bacterium]